MSLRCCTPAIRRITHVSNHRHSLDSLVYSCIKFIKRFFKYYKSTDSRVHLVYVGWIIPIQSWQTALQSTKLKGEVGVRVYITSTCIDVQNHNITGDELRYIRTYNIFSLYISPLNIHVITWFFSKYTPTKEPPQIRQMLALCMTTGILSQKILLQWVLY